MIDKIRDIKRRHRQAEFCGVEVGRQNGGPVACGHTEADHHDPIYKGNLGHEFGDPQKLPYCADCTADWPCDAHELIEFIDQVACK